MRPVQRFISVIIILFASVSLVAAQQKPVQTTDLLKINQLSQIAISPDGKTAAYIVRTMNPNDDDYSSQNQLWMVSVDGSSEPRQVTFHKNGASQPVWHPRGERLAFTRSIDGKSQIFVISMRGGEAMQITHEENGARSPSWSPDGRYLMYAVSYSHQDLISEDEFAQGPRWPTEKPGRARGDVSSETNPNPDGSLEEIRAWLDKNERNRSPQVLNRLNFQGEHNLVPERSYTHWFVLNDGFQDEPVALSSGYYSFSGAVWMPDSRTVIMSGNTQTDVHPDRVMESALYRTTISERSPDRYVYRTSYNFSNPQPSPDGRYIAFRAFDTSERGYNQAEIGVLDTRNGEVTLYGGAVDRSLGNVKWAKNSQHIYAVAPTNGGFPLYRLSLSRGNFERLSSLETGIRDYDVTSSLIVFALTKASNPFELYSATLDMQNKTKISRHNQDWIEERRLSVPERHIVTTDDGFEIEYWVMKPDGFEVGKKYPTVLNIHGGPSAMWGPGEASMWHEFQLFAAHGFGVVYSNPRGSGGYGYDFQKGNHQDWGFGPMNDVLESLDAAAERYSWIDKERLTVTGGSYGGYLVAFIIGNDHRFVAAAAQRGVYELVTFLGEGNAWRLIPDRFEGFPWEEKMHDLLRRESPYTYVHEIRTPLLILHGDNDLRTGVSQSEMLYKSLKIQEKDVEYIRYPNAGHDLSRTGNPKHRMDRLLRMIEFMKRYTAD